MNPWLRRCLVAALVLLALGVPGYYALVLHSPEPGVAPYPLDMAEVRALAAGGDGPKPQAVQVEKIAEFVFAEAMVMAGEPWQGTPIPIYAYRLTFPGHSIIVDAAMASVDGVPEAMVTSFDAAAWQRLAEAMTRAETIVVTHEHFDHIGGILQHPELETLLPRLALTREQLGHEDRMRPLTLPDGVFENYRPLAYDGLHRLAPGVVLVEAPGHTPGSQMVYVQLADGRELLLMGDVSWQMRNIHAVRERPLFMTALIQENRRQVIEQFATLHALAAAEPSLALVPGHDGAAVDGLLARGLLQAGFR